MILGCRIGFYSSIKHYTLDSVSLGLSHLYLQLFFLLPRLLPSYRFNRAGGQGNWRRRRGASPDAAAPSALSAVLPSSMMILTGLFRRKDTASPNDAHACASSIRAADDIALVPEDSLIVRSEEGGAARVIASAGMSACGAGAV